MKIAITIYSDPGSEDALGRCFTAMAAAFEAQERGDEVKVIFGGAGVRWPNALSNKEHPAHELFEKIKNNIQGVCSSCAVVFNATDGAKEAGTKLVGEVAVPNSAGSGLPSIRKLIMNGYTTLSF